MSKFMQILLSLLVAAVAAIAVRTAFDAYYDWRDKNEFNERSADFAAELRDATADAEVLKKPEAIERVARKAYEELKSEATSDREMKATHMGMILGAYSAWLTRRDTCAELGVDISPFVETYRNKNSDVINTAESFLIKNNVDLEEFYELTIASESARMTVEIDMDAMAAEIEGDWTAVCNFLNDFAEEMASEMLIVDLMPEVKEHL